MFWRLFDIVLCSVAVPSDSVPNVFFRVYMTYNVLYDILPIGIDGRTGLHRMCVLEDTITTVAGFISMSRSVASWLTLVGARIVRSIAIGLRMSFSQFVRVCCCSDTIWNGPSARASNLLYVVFAIASAECVAVAESAGRSTSSMSHGVNVQLECTELS